MAITTGERIVIVLAEAADRPIPEPWLLTRLDVRVSELPPAESPTAESAAFALHIIEGGQEREARLSDAESRHLVTLLEQLPPQSMTADVRSFDGVIYELVVVRADQTLSFNWQNEDWRHDPQSPKEEWERVAAVTDYVLQLVKMVGPATN
jgi:hypothetical protein